METYSLKTETLIPAPLEKVWDFFSNPQNLRLLTPDYMNFHILKCPETEEIFEGMRIEYKVSPLLHIPIKWVTKIQEVAVYQKFQDIQLSGPFALWEHTHTFEDRGHETFMTDEVKYRPPFGLLGRLANSLFVEKQLHGIFAHREKVIRDVFPG